MMYLPAMRQKFHLVLLPLALLVAIATAMDANTSIEYHHNTDQSDLLQRDTKEVDVAISEYSDMSSNATSSPIFEDDRPQWKKTVDLLITIMLTFNTIMLMMGMGCATYWREVVHNAWPPTGVLIGMTGQFLLLPACGSFLSWVCGLAPYEAMGVLVVSCSPGGSFSNFFTYWCDGDLALSIVMTTFSSTLAFVGMPFNLWLHSKIFINTDESSILVIPYVSIMTALLFIIIPVAVGMTIRHFRQRVASYITKVASVLSWVVCGVLFVLWTVLYWRVFVNATPLIYLCSVLLPVVGFSLSYCMARLLRRSHRVCRTIGIETGYQNMFVALSIVLLSFSDPVVKSSMILFPTLYGLTLLVEMFIGIGSFQAWKKYHRKAKTGDGDDDDDADYLPELHQATIEKGSCKERLSLQTSIKSNF